MPEHGRSERLRTGTPFGVGSVAVLPIERIVTHAHAGTRPAWCSVTMAPYALLLRDAAGIRAVGLDDATISLEALREQVPDLDAVLRSM